MPFQFKHLALPGVIIVEPQVYSDDRGFFTEVYKASDFLTHGMTKGFDQINQSRSVKGVLRGLHYQLDPYAQDKLVKAIQGEIFDVAVDLRVGSPGYGKWVGEYLSAENKRMLYIPRGFAHGFCVTSETAEIIYFVSGGEYAPQYDRGIIWNDPAIGIEWPAAVPILSEKDLKHMTLKSSDNNFIYHEQ